MTEINNKTTDTMSEKHNCDCGGKFTFYNYSKHIKSDKHQKFLNGNESENKFKIFCKCGGRHNNSDQAHHRKTKMHMNYMRNFFKDEEDFQNEYHLNPNDEKIYDYLINKKNIKVKNYYEYKNLLLKKSFKKI